MREEEACQALCLEIANVGLSVSREHLLNTHTHICSKIYPNVELLLLSTTFKVLFSINENLRIASFADCGVEENTKYSGHNLYTTKGVKVGNMAGCADLCFKDKKCKFWTFNPR